jgi:APA family basic amino acid/polyamine antiporter
LSFCILLIVYKPTYTWPGLIITLLGIPLYYLLVARKKTKTIAKEKEAAVVD